MRLVLLFLLVSLAPHVAMLLVAVRLMTLIPQPGGLLRVKRKGQPVAKTVAARLVQRLRYPPLLPLFVRAKRVIGPLHYVVAGRRVRMAVL